MLCVLIRIASCTIIDIKKKTILNYPKSAAIGFFQGTQERLRNSRGKRAISVRAINALLFIFTVRTDSSVVADKISAIMHVVDDSYHVILQGFNCIYANTKEHIESLSN